MGKIADGSVIRDRLTASEFYEKFYGSSEQQPKSENTASVPEPKGTFEYLNGKSNGENKGERPKAQRVPRSMSELVGHQQ